MRTRTGRRTAHLKIQIVQDNPSTIRMFFDEDALRPLNFKRSDEKYFERLLEALDLYEDDVAAD